MKEGANGGRASETQQHMQGQADAETQDRQTENNVRDVQDVGGADYQALLSKQEARIKELEGQVAEAAKTAEAADALRGEIEQIQAQAADERVEFQLRLAGVRNVKAAKALLDDNDGDVSALKATEPWLFADKPNGNNAPSGVSSNPVWYHLSTEVGTTRS